jgi:hypothetical protein
LRAADEFAEYVGFLAEDDFFAVVDVVFVVLFFV